mgnify:CR=1 FL=1
MIDDEEMMTDEEMLADIEKILKLRKGEVDCCTRPYCMNEAVFTDVLRLRWCEEHKFCGECINWAAAHKFPPLDCYPYSILNDPKHPKINPECWKLTLGLGPEDAIYLVQAAIENIESHETVE